MANGKFKGYREIEEYGEISDDGAEHNVWMSGAFSVLKATKDREINPASYLENAILQNAAFNDQIELECVFIYPSGRIGILVSQPFRDGKHPTSQEPIDSFMADQGFRKIGTLPIYEGHGVKISDAGPRNWIQNPATGSVIPIDLQISLLP